jgi:hypothetical protein
MRDKYCETHARVWVMTVTGKFTMTRIEILAVSLRAANYADDPNRSPALQLRRLLDMGCGDCLHRTMA